MGLYAICELSGRGDTPLTDPLFLPTLDSILFLQALVKDTTPAAFLLDKLILTIFAE
jgi:hypothetical protein